MHISTLMGLSQKFEVGLVLEKQSEYMNKKGKSVNVVHDIKRNLSISDEGEIFYIKFNIHS